MRKLHPISSAINQHIKQEGTYRPSVLQSERPESSHGDVPIGKQTIDVPKYQVVAMCPTLYPATH